VSNDSVATRPRLPRETRGLSDGHVDGVEATRLHEDAVDANLKFRKVRKQTPSQHVAVGHVPSGQ
jgi:hypothetical protein